MDEETDTEERKNPTQMSWASGIPPLRYPQTKVVTKYQLHTVCDGRDMAQTGF